MTTEELKAILDAKEPPVVVNADGTCRPLTYDELQAALAAAQEERDRLKQLLETIVDALTRFPDDSQSLAGMGATAAALLMAEASAVLAGKPTPAPDPPRTSDRPA